MNKKIFYLLMSALVVIFALLALPSLGDSPGYRAFEEQTLAGRYVGYSWRGEVQGVELFEADQYIETILELEEDGTIASAKMRFFVLQDGYWILRQSGNTYVSVDFAADPQPAEPGDDYSPGVSMFTIHNADMMSFYAAAADQQGQVALVLVCPATRYQFEIKLPPNFDYATPIDELTVGSGMLVPTVRTSSSGATRPDNWDELADKHFFNLDRYSYVVTMRGIFAGLDGADPVKALLEAMGIGFSGEVPLPFDVDYGYFGNGGWAGNYTAIEENLTGQNARELTSLIDWSDPRYAASINEDNFFGVDLITGATRTVQNGIDTISGATVRMSREATSYQRALVEAGILREDEVVVGRF